jgi:hypothetical protein
MFGLFGSASFTDPQLGELRRSGGVWRGTVRLEGAALPLAVSGSRTAPDAEALRLARSVPAEFAAWRPTMERALYEHHSPYAEAVADGEADAPASGLPTIDTPSSVWPHTSVEFVRVSPLSGELTVEIGCRVAWDEEHTLGVRLRDGRLVELCGSVLAP